MIFLDQFKVPTIKFGKCFAEFMIPIALLNSWKLYRISPDGVPYFAASHLGLLYLHMFDIKDARLIWVNLKFTDTYFNSNKINATNIHV